MAGALCLLAAAQAPAQAAADPADLAAPLAALKGLSGEITQTLDSTHWQKWKLKPEQKEADDRALTSLHRDLDQVLPPLLDAAQKNPSSVPAGLAVFRNVNAFYNVLLRLEQTAEFVARDDAQPLNDELSRLEIVRNHLGDQLLQLAKRQDAELATARAALAERHDSGTGSAEHPRRIVVDDAASDKKKTTGKKPATKTATKPSTKSATKPAGSKPSAATQQ